MSKPERSFIVPAPELKLDAVGSTTIEEENGLVSEYATMPPSEKLLAMAEGGKLLPTLQEPPLIGHKPGIKLPTETDVRAGGRGRWIRVPKPQD